ncbi:MAG: O-antigen ligase family protein [Flavobacteriales bacterium]|nr:O-antigen ligase family protein [Flavobacteriales bacterium]
MTAGEAPPLWRSGSERLLHLLPVLLCWAMAMLPAAVPIVLGLLLIAVLVARFGGSKPMPRRNAAFGPMTVMALFYAWHVVGMLWSKNQAFGRFDLEIKAVLLLFPVVFWLWPSGVKLRTGQVWQHFVLAQVVATAVCLLGSCVHFGHEIHLRSQDLLPADPAYTNHFFESRFALFLHPSYMAMYLCFALSLWFYADGATVRSRVLAWVFPALLVLGVVLCNSKMGWLTLALVMAHALWTKWKDPASRRRLSVLAVAGTLVFGGLFIAFPTVSGKLTQAISATGAIDPSSDQSSALRRMAWDAATDLFAAHPIIGVGTGDIKDALIDIYHTKGYVHAEAERLNAHSQFLQSAAALGLIGLSALLAMVLLPVIAAWRRSDRPALLFWLIILLNWSVESMAEVQAGVVFMAFFAWMIALRAGSRTA